MSGRVGVWAEERGGEGARGIESVWERVCECVTCVERVETGLTSGETLPNVNTLAHSQTRRLTHSLPTRSLVHSLTGSHGQFGSRKIVALYKWYKLKAVTIQRVALWMR